MNPSRRRPVVLASDRIIPAAPIVRTIMDVAIARGADPHRLLRGTGLFEQDMGNAHRVSPSQLIRLMANARQYSAGHDCAFQVGRSLASSHLSGLFHAIAGSRNSEQAARLTSLFRWAVCPFVSAARYADQQHWYWVWQDSLGNNRQWPFVVEMVCSALVAFSKQGCGQRLPFHFDFPFARPRYIQEYEEHLGYRLRFSQPMLVVRLEKTALARPFIKPDRFFQQAVLNHFKAERARGMTLADHVRCQVRRQPNVTLSEVACTLNMSPATLKRKLSDHQISFKQLVDEVKRQQAIFLLSVQKLNNQQTALQMAFSDLTNFRRSVKRWTGLTPSELRGT